MIATHVLSTLLLVTTPATGASGAAIVAEDVSHRLVAPAAELAHASRDLWRAALASRKQRSPDQDAMVAAVFAFAGAAELSAGRLGSHDMTRDEMDEILRDLDALGTAVDRAIDQTPTTGDLRRAWDGTRAAWRNLKDRAAGPAPATGTGATGAYAPYDGGGATGSTGSAGPTGATAPAAPPELAATITESRWAGIMNPDLKLAGTFEGKGLVKADIVVTNSSGTTIYSNSENLTNQVLTATSGKSTSTRVTVPWTYSFENEELAGGENTITVSVTNSRGTRAWTKTQLVRRQF